MLQFKLTGTLEESGVPLAVLTGRDLDSRNNVSVADFAHKIPENIVSHTGASFTLPCSPNIRVENDRSYVGFNVSEGVSSSQIFITNKVSLRNNVKPSPLFFKYKIGRGVRAVYVAPDVDVTSDDYKLFLSHLDAGSAIPVSLTHYMNEVTESIRNSLTIYTRNKNIADIGWDIGNIKPLRNMSSQFEGMVFNVDLYTSEQNNKGKTYILSYNAYNIGLSQTIIGKNEVINATPICTTSADIINAVDGTKRITVKAKIDERFASILN